jgi:hypothetical protein
MVLAVVLAAAAAAEAAVEAEAEAAAAVVAEAVRGMQLPCLLLLWLMGFFRLSCHVPFVCCVFLFQSQSEFPADCNLQHEAPYS